MIDEEPTGVAGATAAPDPTDHTESARRSPGRRFAPSSRSWLLLVGAALAVVVLARSFDAARNAVGIIGAGFWLAVLTRPAVTRLARRSSAGGAAALVTLASIVVVLAGEALLFRDLRTQADAVRQALESAVGRLDGEAARLAGEADVSGNLDRIFSELPVRVLGGDGGTGSLLSLAGRLVAVSVLAAFVQLGAGPLTAWVVRRWPIEQRGALRIELEETHRRAIGHVRATLGLSALVLLGTVATAELLDLPGPMVLAAWAAVWTWLSPFGLAVGFAPFVVLGWSAGGSTRWGACVAVAVATVGLVAVRHRIDARTVRLGSAIPALAMLLGFLWGGLVGATAAWGLAATAAVVATRRPWAHIDTPLQLADRWIAAGGAPAGDAALTTISWRSLAVGAAVVVAALVGWWLAATATLGLLLAAIGLLVTLAFDRPVSALQRRMGRSLAIVAVFGLLIAAATALTMVAARTDIDVATSLAQDAPDAVADAEDLPLIGGAIERADLHQRVRAAVADLPGDLARGGVATRVVTQAGLGLGVLVWTILFVIGCLVDGPRLVRRAELALEQRVRPRIVRLGRGCHEAVAGYAAGSAVVALLNATMVFVVAVAVGLPLAPVLAAWAFFANFVPQIGGLLGGAPLVLLAATQGPVQALVAAAVFIAYQNVENHVIQPAIVSHAIDVPPWLTLAAALVGGAVGGVPGAVLATPLVGLARVLVVTRLGRLDPPPRTPRRRRGLRSPRRDRHPERARSGLSP